MTPEEEVRRAGKAREILDNELFKEAISDIEEALKSARVNSAATVVDLREKLWAQEVALYTVVRNIRTHIETGEMAQQTLAEKAREFFNG